MAEEATAAQEAEQGQATPEVQEDQPIDWKAKYEAMRAHSREWEKQAKANKDAATELEQLKATQLTEQEKAVKRAEKAEAELQALKAEAERAAVVSSIADDANVPSEVVALLNGADEEELRKQVARLMKLLPAYPSRTDDGGGKAVAKKSNADRFAEALGI